jgi:hypothetical protein
MYTAADARKDRSAVGGPFARRCDELRRPGIAFVGREASDEEPVVSEAEQSHGKPGEPDEDRRRLAPFDRLARLARRLRAGHARSTHGLASSTFGSTSEG